MTFRIIPALLLKSGGVYKTTGFKDPKYVGDPINAVRVFNDKEVDEIIVLDIGAAGGRTPVDVRLVGDIAGEAFMPMCYGGGITSRNELEAVLELGVEKVSFNSAVVDQPSLVEAAVNELGSQSVVVGIDVKRRRLRAATAWTRGGTHDTGVAPAELAKRAVDLGAGEILLGSIDRDGSMSGYDIDLIRHVTAVVDVPVVAFGGAGTPSHFIDAMAAGASGVAAGSMFVFHGPRRAVLISYPTRSEREALHDALRRARDVG